MKRNKYGLTITVISIVLVAASIAQQLGGLSTFSVQSQEPDYVDGDYVGYIAPKGDPVTDEESALAAAAKIFDVDESMLSSSMEDGTENDEGEKYYKLQQMSGGLPVYGRRVNLSVDDGDIYLASGNLREVDFPEDTEPTIDEVDAQESLSAYVTSMLLIEDAPDDLEVSLTDFGDLCIYDQDEYEANPRLAYSCSFVYSSNDDDSIYGSYDAVIDANTAEVFNATSNIYAATEYVTYTNQYGNYNVELECSGDSYIFEDKARNLRLYNAEGGPMNSKGSITFPENTRSDDDIDDLTFYFINGEKLQIYTMPKKTLVFEGDDAKALRMFSHAQASYDFYWQVLGRKGFNNGNGQMNLAINHCFQGKVAYSLSQGNATLIASEWSASGNLNTLTVMAHEFTHSVEHSISAMAYEGESGAIMEGYSDTLGVLADTYVYDKDPTWKCGSRDLSTGKPDGVDYVYKYSYMVSYPAYRIWNDWTKLGVGFSEKIDDLSHLYYRALYLLDTYANFNQWYWAMEQVAQYMFQNGELTQEQLDAVLKRIGEGREENEDIEKNLEMIKAVAVLMANDYEYTETTKLTDTIRESSSISLIPEITEEMFNQVGTLEKNVKIEDPENMMVHKDAMFYYLAALFGEDFAAEFTDGNVYTLEDEWYSSGAGSYNSIEDLCTGWSWEITKTELLQEGLNMGYHAALVSPTGEKYKIVFLLTGDAGGYTGAFMNGYYLSDMSVTPDGMVEETDETDDDTVLLDWLESLTKQCGVIEVGTEEYYSAEGNYEHVIPDSRITGLLAADVDDYDGDGCNELFVVRVEPHTEQSDGYSTGGNEELYVTDIVLEMYGVQDGEVHAKGVLTFPLSGVSETWYQASAHVFKVKGEDGVKLYFDHFFSFNSQTFATIQLEYIDGTLRVTDGAELSEFAHSAGCYQAVSNEACDNILCHQFNDGDYAGWKECSSGDWDDYDDEYESVTWDTFQDYISLLDGMRLTESVSRSQFWGDWDGGSYASLSAEYGRCYLRPAERFTADSGSLEAICSLIAPYGQGSVTLTVEDETELLYAYRTGQRTDD